MLALFCVRLAFGLLLVLPVLWRAPPHPRFVRSQFLVALGLVVVAGVAAWSESEISLRAMWILSAIALLCGALSWTLDPPPAGRPLIIAGIAVLFVLLASLEPALVGSAGAIQSGFWALNGVVSALALGATMTAMLVGHSYLIAPGLALTPLLNMLTVLFVALAGRAIVAAGGLAFCLFAADGHTLTTEVLLWLPVRWLVGIVGPLAFGWMATSSAKIRSTQSATGILYVAVVCTILGELLSLLLTRQTGLPL